MKITVTIGWNSETTRIMFQVQKNEGRVWKAGSLFNALLYAGIPEDKRESIIDIVANGLQLSTNPFEFNI